MGSAAATHSREVGSWRSSALWEWDWLLLDYRTYTQQVRRVRWRHQQRRAWFNVFIEDSFSLLSRARQQSFSFTCRMSYLKQENQLEKCKITFISFVIISFGCFRTLRVLEDAAATAVLWCDWETCCLLTFMRKTAAYQAGERQESYWAIPGTWQSVTVNCPVFSKGQCKFSPSCHIWCRQRWAAGDLLGLILVSGRRLTS